MSKHRADEYQEVEPVPEGDGDPVSATFTMQPQAWYMRLEIGNGIEVNLMVPHSQIHALDVALASIPSLVNNALLQLRVPDEEIDDEDGR